MNLRGFDRPVDGGKVLRKSLRNCSLTIAFLLQEALLPLSLGCADPAPVPWGATMQLSLNF